MSFSASATVTSDISFQLVQTGSAAQTESASLGYSRSLSNGTGSLQINYGLIKSGTLPSGGVEYLDFRAIGKEFFGVQSNVQFSKVKSIVIENNSTQYGFDFDLIATGTNALTEMFNGGSGNLPVKPYGTYMYTDAISGVIVDGTNKDLAIHDAGSGADWTLIVVGVTG